MKSNSFISSHDLLVTTATVAAHSSADSKLFRQKDVFFFFELFSNWCQSGIFNNTIKYQNTQIARYLEYLTTQGYAYKTKNTARPTYCLSRVGLLELIFRITNYTASNPEQFFFSYYFIANYKERLINLVKEEGKQFPPTLRTELFALLDEKLILQREIERVRKLRIRLSQRISEAQAINKITVSGLRRGTKVSEIIKTIQQQHPYELNNQKPLSELLSSIPADQQLWEIGDGATKRAEHIWSPTLELVESYYKTLKLLN